MPAPAPPRVLSGRQHADWAVLGAGFTGLSAAARLADHQPGSRIILLEAQRVGFGASGRNSGFVVDVAHYNDSLDREGNCRLIRIARAGIARLRELVHRHGIECAWTERGILHGAVGDVGMRRLTHFRRGLDDMEEPYEWLDSEALAAVTGTRSYRAAARTPGGALVQPAALVRGLASALPPNVELLETSPIHSIHRGATLRLESSAGAVSAKRLLLTVNGFSSALCFPRRGVVPLLTFASLTAPLRDEALTALGGDREWGLVPEERMGTTVRRTRDNRILIRNSVRYSRSVRVGDAERRRVRELHRRSFQARFPMLSGAELQYSWCGVLGITLNDVQLFGRLEPNVFASAAYNGVGVAIGTAAGSLLADLAVGADSDLLADIRALPQPSWVPPEPILGLGVRAALRSLQSRAGAEL